MSQNPSVRTQSSVCVLVTIVAISGCLSESLIDNYHDGDGSAVQLGGGGVSGYTNAINVWSHRNDRDAVLSVSGYVSQLGGRSSGSSVPDGAGTAGVASAGLAYQMAGYWSLDASVGRVELGTTASDHLIAIYEAPVHAAEGGLASVVRLCLVELTASGELVRQVIFEEGRMPDVCTVMPDGSVVLAGQLDRDVSYDGPTISKVQNGVFVARLDADWRYEYGFAIPTDRDFVLKDMALDADGAVCLAMSEQNGSSATLQHSLLGYGPDGKERFRASSFAVSGIVLDDSAQVLAIGTLQVDSAVDGQVQSAANGIDGLLMSFDKASRSGTVIGQFGGRDSDWGSVIGLAPEGHLRIGGQVGRQAALFGKTLNGSSLGTPFVADVDVEGKLNFIAALGSVGTVTDLVQQQGRTFTAGYLHADPSQGTDVSGGLYAAVIEEDGLVSSVYRVKARAESVARLAVDSGGTIWLHGMADVGSETGGNVSSSAVLVRLVHHVL